MWGASWHVFHRALPDCASKTLEDFDFRLQSSIDERQVRELAELAFVREAANVLFLGPAGAGKTHLAVARGLKAIEMG